MIKIVSILIKIQLFQILPPGSCAAVDNFEIGSFGASVRPCVDKSRPTLYIFESKS